MALDAMTHWEVRSSGSGTNRGGGFRWVSLVNSTYKWTASGSGTNEYYVELAGGGDPSLTEPTSVTTDGTFNLDTNGTLGSLNAGEWDWGDNDTLGYSTVYVRLDDGADPDTQLDDFVSMGFGGGTDYTQQSTAQLTLTDLATSGIGVTTLTSATGGFTALMVGNLIQIDGGTNVTTGYYEITAYTDTNTVTLDRAPDDGVGGIASGTGKVGGAMVFNDKLTDAVVAGNTIHIGSGTHTPTSNVASSVNGTQVLPVRYYGYNTVRHDNPVGTNRPLLAMGANSFNLNDYIHVDYIDFTTTQASGIGLDQGSLFYGCKAVNSSGTAGRDAFNLGGTYCRMVDCEAQSTNGDAVYVDRTGCVICTSYIHDSDIGITEGTIDLVTVIGNVFDTNVSNGIKATDTGTLANYGWVVVGNVFYNSGTAIKATDALAWIIYNNMFVNNTTGMDWTNRMGSNFVDHNLFYNNTTDVVNIDYGPNAVFGDPSFVDAANGDFTLQSGSAALDAGMQLANVGLTGDYKINIGVDQDDVSAGGGGLLVHPGTSGGARG